MKPNHTVLVTGGAGYIGSHTCKALYTSGYIPVVLDNLSTGHANAVKWGPLIEADIRDGPAVADAIKNHKPKSVIHFAASAYVGESVQKPEIYYQNNVCGMLNLLQKCMENGLMSMVFSSSCATYGIPEKLPISESSPQKPINPYGRTKLIGEQILKDYAHAYNFSYSILRYFNACGADPEGEIGERHDPETHLIPLALMAASDPEREFELFGTDYPTPDGTCIRDFIHVSDLARAHVLALNHVLAGGENISVNLGSGNTYSVQQILDFVVKITGKNININQRSARPGDPPELCADVNLAKTILNFKTSHSELNEIIKTAAPFFDH